MIAPIILLLLFNLCRNVINHMNGLYFIEGIKELLRILFRVFYVIILYVAVVFMIVAIRSLRIKV